MTKADGQRQRILRAAVRLFSQRGYHATSLKQLARQAGMTAPNLYHYYRSKEEILFEVHNSQLTPLLEELDKLREAEPDPVERIRAFAYGMVLVDLEEPLAGFVPSNHLVGLRGTNAKTIRGKMRAIRDHWVTTIEQGVEGGRFNVTEPKLAALNALTMCSYVTSWFDAKGSFSKTDVAKEAAESVVRMLGHYESER